MSIEQGVRRVLVVDGAGRREGVVSFDELLPLLADQLGEPAMP